MRNVLRAALVAAAVPAGLIWSAAVSSAGDEPRYHWCPGEQWSDWMGANWDTQHCHDNHYLDNVSHTPENWRGGGEYDPNWPPRGGSCNRPGCSPNFPYNQYDEYPYHP